MLASVGASLGRSFTLTPAAVARLERFPWPGNLEQLAQVLRRSALLAAVDRLGPDDLLFEAPRDERLVPPVATIRQADGPGGGDTEAAGGRGGAPPVAAIESRGGGPSAPSAGDTRLELVLTELAHELKNPMVTIKTFADHLPSLLEDAELRERFAALTNEAIGRMDGLLDTVLDFARLGAPQPRPVVLAELLDAALEVISAELAERQGRVRRDGWSSGATVVADPKHLDYAFRNLFVSLVRELRRDHELTIRIDSDARVELRLAGAVGVATKLQGFLEGAGGVPAPTALPLRFVLARAVLVRGGGEVAVDASDSDGDTIVRVVSGRAAARATA
jgi:signal transduction histidine kinase